MNVILEIRRKKVTVKGGSDSNNHRDTKKDVAKPKEGDKLYAEYTEKRDKIARNLNEISNKGGDIAAELYVQMNEAEKFLNLQLNKGITLAKRFDSSAQVNHDLSSKGGIRFMFDRNKGETGLKSLITELGKVEKYIDGFIDRIQQLDENDAYQQITRKIKSISQRIADTPDMIQRGFNTMLEKTDTVAFQRCSI